MQDASVVPDFDPITTIGAAEQRFQIASAKVVGRLFVDALRKPLQDSDRHVPEENCWLKNRNSFGPHNRPPAKSLAQLQNGRS